LLVKPFEKQDFQHYKKFLVENYSPDMKMRKTVRRKNWFVLHLLEATGLNKLIGKNMI